MLYTGISTFDLLDDRPHNSIPLKKFPNTGVLTSTGIPLINTRFLVGIGDFSNGAPLLSFTEEMLVIQSPIKN
jgi:hypothetical protein